VAGAGSSTRMSRTRIAAWIVQQENSDTGTALRWSV
jgi:hypothetical protein